MEGAAVLHGIVNVSVERYRVTGGTAGSLIDLVQTGRALLQNGTMERRQLFQTVRIGQVAHRGKLVVGAYIDAFDPVRIGDIFAQTEHIEANHQRDDRQYHGQRRRTQPTPAGEHLEGFVQQHLNAEVDDQARNDLAHQQHVDALGAGHQIPKQDAQTDAAGQRDDVQHDGPQPREHDGVAGGLAVAGAVEQIGEEDQHHGDRGIDQQRRPAGGGQVRLIPAVLGTRDQRALAVADLAEQPDNRRQAVDPSGPAAALKAPDEELRHKGEQQIESGKHEVDTGVDHGDGQQPAGDHGAGGGQREEEQARQLRHRQPFQRTPHVDDAVSGLHRQGNEGGGHMHRGEDQHAHGEMYGELAATGNGQGVHQARAAAVHQIGEQRHGQQHGEAGGHDGCGCGAAPQMVVEVIHGRHHVLGIVGPVPLVPQGQREGAQPHDRIAEQQRPEPAEVGAGQRPVRGRYHEPHNRHLPTRK